MKIKGKVHCLFEQSGTFKNEFRKLGIPAEDYDIQNNFGQTDHVIDLFAEIDKAYDGGGVYLRRHDKGRPCFGVLPVHILLQYSGAKSAQWAACHERQVGHQENVELEA